MEHGNALEAEFAALWRRSDAVLISNDADAIARGFADDWVGVDTNGYTTKAELIDWIRSGRLAHHSMAIAGELRIRVAGEIAILTARRASTGLWEGSSYAVEEWITDVLERRGGQWVCVFTQKSPVD